MDIWRLVSQGQFVQPAMMTHHNHWLCLVAVLLAILAASVLLPVIDRYQSSKGSHRYLWLIAGSVGMGTGIWAMHFTAMLSFSLPVPIRYDLTTTILSIVPAMLASGSCIWLYAAKQHTYKHLHMAAILMALGIGTMHYTGMEAIVVSAQMYYLPSYFFLSILAAYVFAVIGLYARFHITAHRFWSAKWGNITGSIVLGLAVSSMHFTAMRATYFQADATSIISHHSIPSYNLIIGIILTSVFLLGLIIIGSLVDKRMWLMSESLKSSRIRFQRLAETTQTAIFTFNNKTVTYANPALGNITGHNNADILSLPLAEIFCEGFSVFANEVFLSHAPFGQAHYEQFEIKNTKGETRWLYFSVTLAEIDNEATGLASACDISEQKIAELNMRQLAYNDQLTQLGNRVMFIDRLEHHLALLKRRNSQQLSCVMLLDLDNFKLINDTYGHLKGDQLLIGVANRLKKLARNVDTIARLGGDEFILLFEELDTHLSASIIADRIIESLSEPYNLSGREILVNSSIGVLELNSSYEKSDQVLHDVDIALYRAKQQGRACWVLFDQDLDAKVKRARQLQLELSKAVSENKLQLYYQPIVDVGNHNLRGFEALARWQRSNGEWVSPVEFIPLAEDCGLIFDIGLWALETACEQLATWNKENKEEDIYISVNVTPVSFYDGRFVQKTSEVFNKFGLKKGQLKLELTESMLVNDSDKMIDNLNKLITLGCELMIDDFGTGYSSLSYLHRLPINTLKVDRSFVSQLNNSESTVPIIRTIIALAKSLSMSVISEGVETEAQSSQLSSLGSNQLQGYLFSKPLPANDATLYLQTNNHLFEEGRASNF